MIQVISVVFNISEGCFGKREPICFEGSQGKEVGFPGSSVVKNPSPSAGDMGSVPGLGRSTGGGQRNPLLYSCLENPMAREAW